MEKNFSSIFFILIFSTCYGQKEANYWAFGDNVGINFNNNYFCPFNGTNLDQPGGSAAISNPLTGELLFYTDGRNVFNRNFNFMPNGTGLYGGFQTSQAALIIPHPGNNDHYLVFTTRSFSDSVELYNEGLINTGLHYSIVDMSGDNGMGAVRRDRKNTLLLKKATEKLTAVRHDNMKDYWIISHEWGSNKFVVYLLNSKGVNLSDSFSFGNSFGHYEAQGWLLPSPDGTMLACAVSSLQSETAPLQLLDFNSLTGEISNYRELGEYPQLNGVSFSPDNSKFYFSYFDTDQDNPTGNLSQMDLSEESLEAIINSKTDIVFLHQIRDNREVYDTLSGGALQLAPDGRLYTSLTGAYLTSEAPESEINYRIFCINKPNLPGLLCEPSNRKFNAIIRAGNGSSFPNFLQHTFNNLEPIDNFGECNEKCTDPISIIYPNPTPGIVNINLNKNCYLNGYLTIYSVLGKHLGMFEVTNDSFAIDISLFSSGLYMFVFQFPNNQISKKVIKL
ncbi:MAG: T9SS type A sorting domain-containing protein [Bacteroidota bacterium]|nr:T9SS type A sorting domain-containing protein [Bacteroidota bacterium]MDQ3534933.1 T9SS type A sorting domain-containing protein [Bacteroidota bacterium]